MPLDGDEPVPEIADIVMSGFDEQALSVDPTAINDGDGMGFETDYYRDVEDRPVVTFTGLATSPLDGGETAITAMSNKNRKQVRTGGLDITSVGGTRNDLRGTAPDGSDVSPKVLRREICEQVSAALVTTPLLDSYLWSLMPGSDVDREDDLDESTIAYRNVLRARFTYEL